MMLRRIMWYERAIMNLNLLSVLLASSISVHISYYCKQDFLFIPNNDRCFIHHAGGVSCIGTINADGSFVPDLLDLDKTVQAFKAKVPRSGVSMPPELLGKLQAGDKAYEYRSGYLIPMVVDAKHGLIPEVGQKIIEFKTYKYSPTAKIIYNLPGRFVLKN